MKFQRAPTVVHCSAGIGRSGAVMVIDMISDMLEFYQGEDITVDIKKTVIHCREHRHSMVQTIEQYKFIAKSKCIPVILRN
jgi:protein tyrosine phosphatase